MTLYITGEGTEYKEGEGGGRKRDGGWSSKRERGGVNKKRGEKAEERVELEISRRGSGRGWKVEREEGRERDK